MPPEAVLREVRAWFAKAESDLKNISLTLPAEDCPYDTVCYHAQQAAEKYLKGFLTFHGIPFPKTHYLPELLALAPPTSTLAATVGDLTELAYLATGPRYPDDLEEYTREVAEAASETARRVKEAVLAEMEADGFAP